MKRNILHLRVDGFAVAVERLRDPALKGRPVVVCSRHSPRSPVISVSPEARSEGIREGVPLTRALQRCRRLQVLPPDERLYRQAADTVAGVMRRYSPLVEPGRWGRFYVDLSGTERLFGPAQDSASRIRRDVRDAAGLTSTLGIGSNKLVSGAAARVVESHGDLYAVPPGSEAGFLAPLRVAWLPAIHRQRDRLLLRDLNIRLIRQMAGLSVVQLNAVFGKRGVLLYRQARGIDDRPVRVPESRPFVLEETTLAADTNDDGILLGVLYRMTERACRRLRERGTLPRTLWLHLRHSDGVDVTRRFRLPAPSHVDARVYPHVESLFFKASERRQRVRYLSLTFTDLVFPTDQMSLFRGPGCRDRDERLIGALDGIRSRFGENAVWWGRSSGATPDAGAGEAMSFLCPGGGP